jgi:hypothetical protein
MGGLATIGMTPLTAAERQRRLRASLETTTALGLMATAAPYLNEHDAAGFLGLSSDGVGHPDAEPPARDSEDSNERTELILAAVGGAAEATFFFGETGTADEDLGIFGPGQWDEVPDQQDDVHDHLPMRTAVRHLTVDEDSSLDWLGRVRGWHPRPFTALRRLRRRPASERLPRLPMRTAVRYLSRTANVPVHWLRGMRDWRVRLPASFTAFPAFSWRRRSAPSFSELIAQRGAPEPARPSPPILGELLAPAPAMRGEILAPVAPMRQPVPPPAASVRSAAGTLVLTALAITTFAIGFVAGLYVTLGRGSPAEQPAAVVVTASRLNCRINPSLQARVLSVAKRGEKLHVLEQGAGWWRVRAQDTQCWISSEYAQSVEPGRQQRMRSWLDELGASLGLGRPESSPGEREQSKSP